MITDGTSRHRLGDTELMLFAKLGTFAEYSCVAQSQVIKVDPDLPLSAVALVSCGVATGWGSATSRATCGQMADKVIMMPGVLYGDMMALGTKLAGKGGTIVVTAIAPMTQTESSVNLFELAMWNKEIKGTIFGSLNPRADIPNLLSMYQAGTLKFDELITNTYPLDDINEGYRAMREVENIRGIIAHAT